MADTVKIFGSNLPKPVVYGGAGLIVVGSIYYYRKNKTASAQAAAVTQAGTNSIDPATGYPYGSPEDAAALQTQNNYVSPTGYGYSGYAGGSGSGSFGTGQPGNFLSNAEWAQYVENYEVNNLGADAPTVGNAIGKYLTGQPLDVNSMVPIVQSAIAIGGYPPVNGPNGNPPSYTTTGGATPPPNPPPPSGGGTVTLNTPNGYNGWMTVQFPSNQALQNFVSSSGMHVANGYYYYPNLTNAQWVSFVNAAGGTIISGNSSTNTNPSPP